VSSFCLVARLVAFLASIPAYAVSFLLLFATFPGAGDARGIDYLLAGTARYQLPFTVGALALFVALGATAIALVGPGSTSRGIGVSLGGVLLVAGIAVLVVPILAPTVGFALGAVGLALVFAGTSLGGDWTARG
jgi:hypothetical protein